MQKARKYKAVRYDIPDNPYDPTIIKTRFYIVSTETGEVLDDADGEGYRSAQKAYAGFAWKNRDKSRDAERLAKMRQIGEWLEANASFRDRMRYWSYAIRKGAKGPDAKFDAKFVKGLLKECGLEPDFTVGELLRAWRHRRQWEK